MYHDIISPHNLLTLAKITALLIAAFAIAPLIKNPGLRSSLWITTILALPVVIVLSSTASFIQLIPEQKSSTLAASKTPLIPEVTDNGLLEVETFFLLDSPALEAAPPLSATPQLIESTSPQPSPFPWLPTIYLLGAILVILPHIHSQIKLRLLKKSPPSGKPHTLWNEVSSELGLQARLQFTTSPSAPFASGILKPTILIPNESETWSSPRLTSVLLHEAAHLKRRDPLTRYLSSTVKALLWFHPLVWLAHRQLIASQEQACDQYALNFGIEPEDYAADLLRSAAHSHTTPSQALAMARWSQIGNRIRHILNSKNHSPTTMKKIASLSALVSLSALAISSIGFAKQVTTETTTTTTTTTVKETPDTPRPKLPKTSSTATIQIHPRVIALAPGTNNSSQLPLNYVEIEFEAIVAPETLKLAAQALKIDLKKNKNAIADLKSKIRTAPVRGTDFVEIIAHHTDKKEATRIANAVANAYLERRTAIEAARTKKALAALDDELIKQSDLVQKHRQDLTILIQQYGIPYFDGNNTNPMGTTEEEMFQNARKKLTDFQTQRDQLKIQLKELGEKKDDELLRYAAGLTLPENKVTLSYTKHREALEKRAILIAKGLAEKHPEIAADLALKQHNYTQGKEAYEQSRSMLREMKIKQQEARVLLKMPRAPITLHERAR
ncbi:MAG: hypothetical protein ACJAQT_001391 [Akkermansiaceae bacterium]|jgi:hypothetical protein